MIRNSVALLVGVLGIGSPVFAEGGIFKCTDADGAIVYQGHACTGRQSQMTLVEPRKREPDALPVDAAAAKAVDSSAASALGEHRSVLRADALVVGMSDTKVLNMRGWGRPKHIARARAEDGYREEWTYVGRGDGVARVVQFVNGKVAAIRSQDEQNVASVSTRPSLEASVATSALARRAEQDAIAWTTTSEKSGARAQSAEPAARTSEPTPITQSLEREAAGERGPTWQNARTTSEVSGSGEATASSYVKGVQAPRESAVARPENAPYPAPPLHVVRTEPAPLPAATRPEPVTHSGIDRQLIHIESPTLQ